MDIFRIKSGILIVIRRFLGKIHKKRKTEDGRQKKINLNKTGGNQVKMKHVNSIFSPYIYLRVLKDRDSTDVENLLQIN